MRSKKSQCEDNQLELGKTLIESFTNRNDELIRISRSINWDKLCKRFGEKFDDKTGRLGLPMRLMIGLTFFKDLNDLSKELARRLKLLKDKDLSGVIVDTTVQDQTRLSIKKGSYGSSFISG